MTKQKEPWYQRVAKRLPKRIIPSRHSEQDEYLIRYKLFRIPWVFAIFIHEFAQSDDDMALHDHPWPYAHRLLEGEYYEVTPKGRFLRKPGKWGFHTPFHKHRVELLKDSNGQEKRVWTIFIRGPRVCRWGFWCKQGWIHWKKFIKHRRESNFDC